MFWYVIFRLGAFLVRRLPVRWGIALCRWLGRVIYRLSPVAEASRDNARHVLGPDADPARVSQVACAAFEERVLNYYDMLWLSGLPLEEVTARTSVEGLETVLHLVQEKRGAVAVSGHIGPMEFMIQALASYGYPLIGITEHLESERLHQYLMDLRSVHGLNLISTEGPLLDVYRRIKRGEVLLSTADRDSTGTGLIVDFFGAPAWMPDGYARLAVRANVPLVFAYCIRTQGGVVCKILPSLYPEKSLGKEEAVIDLIERTVRLLEEAICENPAAWHLSTPIWQIAQERLETGVSR
jgi:KDO2-lipid IV(A) lauroyltransferase